MSDTSVYEPPIKLEDPDKGMIVAGVSAARLFRKGGVIKAVRVINPENMTEGVVVHFTKEESVAVTNAIKAVLDRRFQTHVDKDDA